MASPYTPAGYGGNAETSTPYVPCSGLEATPQCCAVNVLGLADLDCKSPPSVPTSSANFVQICGSSKPQCCTLNLLGLALVCTAPPGTQ
ncbi:hypothetical protein SEPCBS57363_004442 [Sporothrix epigloea]|uniref:Hydrophobin n=1 Tax=Sporothrix epigloea TaxID=1892477 RepID=A0ABP0DS68_9PEZI